jgi:hypothetical protein
VKLKPVLLTIAVFGAVLPTFGQIKVAPGNLKENRRTDGFFNNLEVELKISGLAPAKAVRVLVEKAVDDSGKNLVSEKSTGKDFKEIDSSDQETRVDVELKNTERRATRLQELSGSLEVFDPSRDPASTITLPGFQKGLGKPLSSIPLRTAGVELTVWNKEMFDARKKAEEERLTAEMEAKAKKAEKSGEITDTVEVLTQGLMAVFGSMFNSFASMEPNDLALYVKDAQSKLVAIEIEDAAGKKIDHRGKMTMGGDPKTIILSFETRPPADARLKLYVLTQKSTARTPFRLAAVPLP